MSSDAIVIERLGKEYVIGAAQAVDSTLGESLTEWVAGPWRRFRQMAGYRDRARTFWALKDVSFTIGQAEVVGLIGKNGAGKSTLLKILSRITEPTEGRIDLFGRVSSLLEVGIGFHPELSGRDNVFLNGAILGMSRNEIRRKFDEIVEFAEISKFLDTPVKRYSSGMYVRLAFAVAAHLEPDILIVDEVLGVGDQAFFSKCFDRIMQFRRAGKTILCVSHSLPTLTTLCDRGIWLDHGRVVRAGRVEGLIEEYSHSLGAPLTTAAEAR